MTEHQRVPRKVSTRNPAPPEVKIEELEQRRDILKKSIIKAEELSEEIEGALWGEIKSRMDSVVKETEQVLESFDDAAVTSPILYGALGARRTAIRVLGVGEFAKAGEDFQKELVKVEAAIDRYKSANR